MYIKQYLCIHGYNYMEQFENGLNEITEMNRFKEAIFKIKNEKLDYLYSKGEYRSIMQYRLIEYSIGT